MLCQSTGDCVADLVYHYCNPIIAKLLVAFQATVSNLIKAILNNEF